MKSADLQSAVLFAKFDPSSILAERELSPVDFIRYIRQQQHFVRPILDSLSEVRFQYVFDAYRLVSIGGDPYEKGSQMLNGIWKAYRQFNDWAKAEGLTLSAFHSGMAVGLMLITPEAELGSAMNSANKFCNEAESSQHAFVCGIDVGDGLFGADSLNHIHGGNVKLSAHELEKMLG
jgi:hypothetical protein